MKITGIIAEYNPLHAGHIYHINETRRLTGCDYIVCVMGGSLTQRGRFAVMDKFVRARMALEAGADAVIELPAVYACAPANIFAFGGVSILDAIKADFISFGCETDDLNALYSALALSRGESALIKQGLNEGKSYPRALGEAISARDERLGELMGLPNFTLALEYISALEALSSDIKPVVVGRTSAYHGEGVYSASGVRELLNAGKTDEALLKLPESIQKLYLSELETGLSRPELLDAHILTVLRSVSPQSVPGPDAGEGLIDRIKNTARASASVNELIEGVKCKRYTRARIERAITAACLALPNAPAKIPYLRLLGAKKEASHLIKELSLRSGGLLSGDPTKLIGNPYFEAECRATDLRGLTTQSPLYRRQGRELTSGFVSV